MNASKSSFLRRVRAFCPSAALILIILIAVAVTTAAQTNVFVPGNAGGCFGNPLDVCVPFVPALTVNGPATITVTYVSGKETEGNGGEYGPNGFYCSSGCGQLPLEEAKGVFLSSIGHAVALIGVFVPASRVSYSGFAAVDGTKGVATVGIMPNGLFFIGYGKTFPVTGAGTLYLGINDNWVSDNGGGFNVTVSAQ